jgi:hypothetical protein
VATRVVRGTERAEVDRKRALEKFNALSGLASPASKLPVLGRLGWNSYGTAGAQPVANVRIAERRKMA